MPMMLGWALMGIVYAAILSTVYHLIYRKAGLSGAVLLAAWAPMLAWATSFGMQGVAVSLAQGGTPMNFLVLSILPQLIGLVAPLVLLLVNWPAQGRTAA